MGQGTETRFAVHYKLEEVRRHPAKRRAKSHQADALGKLGRWFRDAARPAGGMLVLPTGSGKTFVAVRFLCQEALSVGYKVLWLAHSHHLLEQAFQAFAPAGPRSGPSAPGAGDEERWRNGCELAGIGGSRRRVGLRVVSGSKEHCPVYTVAASDDVVLGTVQTISRAYGDSGQRGLRRFLDAAKGRLAVVVDEAHHAPARSYRRLLESLKDEQEELILLGLTATPTRTVERERGWLGKLFPSGIVHQATASKLMADGVLARPEYIPITTEIVPRFDQAEYQEWVKTAQDLPESVVTELAESRERNELVASHYASKRAVYGKTIMFADRKIQCEMLREMLRRRGVRADAIYSFIEGRRPYAQRTGEAERDHNAAVLDAFKNDELDVLVNVRMLTEGTDVPDVQSVFITRQTRSQILLTQMVGRALRGPEMSGTEKAYIVCFGDRWQQPINFANWDELEAFAAPEVEVAPTTYVAMQLLSVDLVRALSRQMDTGMLVNEASYVTYLPIGWYRAEVQSADGGDDIELVQELVLVFEHEAAAYRALLEHLLQTPPDELYEDENVDFDSVEPELESWSDRFFEPGDPFHGELRLRSLYWLVRHVAQKGEPPRFFDFTARQDHDLDALAKLLAIEKRLDRPSEDRELLAEFQREDRYWSVLYPTFLQFKSSYDACYNRLMAPPAAAAPPAPKAEHEVIPPREVPPEVKRRVKKRDGSVCLCCAETDGRRLQVDHIKAAYYNRTIDPDHLQTLCRVCNRLKEKTEIDFRAKSTSLTAPPPQLPDIEPPFDDDSREWEKYLRRALNFFYGCAAVEAVEVGKAGKNLRSWKVTLHAGNDPAWIAAHLRPIRAAVNDVRDDLGEERLLSISVSAPDRPTVKG